MFIIRVACSGCPDETELVVDSIDEVDALFCDCDYGYVLLSVSEAIPG